MPYLTTSNEQFLHLISEILRLPATFAAVFYQTTSNSRSFQTLIESPNRICGSPASQIDAQLLTAEFDWPEVTVCG